MSQFSEFQDKAFKSAFFSTAPPPQNLNLPTPLNQVLSLLYYQTGRGSSPDTEEVPAIYFMLEFKIFSFLLQLNYFRVNIYLYKYSLYIICYASTPQIVSFSLSRLFVSSSSVCLIQDHKLALDNIRLTQAYMLMMYM